MPSSNYFTRKTPPSKELITFTNKGGNPELYRLCILHGAKPNEILLAQNDPTLSLSQYAACLAYASHNEILEAHSTTHSLLSYLDLRKKGTTHHSAITKLNSLT